MHPWHRSSSPAAFLRHPRGAHADIRPRLRGERASTMRQDSTLTAILPRLPLGIRAADTQASPRGPYMLAASLPLTRRLCGASLRDPCQILAAPRGVGVPSLRAPGGVVYRGPLHTTTEVREEGNFTPLDAHAAIIMRNILTSPQNVWG